jgi:cytochrome d ubiquinol oxidase subunit II
MKAVAVAVVLFAGVTTYAVLGGADFGSGFWDLTAGGPRRGARVRTLVDHSIGPVWEANHVWLIFVLVFLWTGFPRPFAAITTTLFVPLVLAAVGIVLRGAGFAFRKLAATIAEARLFGVIFALSSIITPFFFGTIAGALASGRVPRDGQGDVWRSWTGPSSLLGGTLAVLACAYLAGVFLASDAATGGDEALAGRMVRGVLAVGALTGVVAAVGVLPLERDAPKLWDNLSGRGAPLLLASAVAGAASLALLRAGAYRKARVAAVGAVASIVVGWGVGQYPWLLLDQVTIRQGAGAEATLTALLVTAALALVIVLPPLVWLFRLVQEPTWHQDHPEASSLATGPPT